MRIFFDAQIGEEHDLLLIFYSSIGIQRNSHLISYSVDIYNYKSRIFIRQFPVEIGNHIWFGVCASTTAMATILTISLTELPNCSTWTGLFIPIRMGPMASELPISVSSL